jgi:hypothetical protein
LGRQLIASCQVKILIFKGRQAFQINFAQGQAAPWRRELYIELTENCPEGSRAQDTLSCLAKRVQEARSSLRAAQQSRSAELRERRKWIFNLGDSRARLTEIA